MYIILVGSDGAECMQDMMDYSDDANEAPDEKLVLDFGMLRLMCQCYCHVSFQVLSAFVCLKCWASEKFRYQN